MIDISKYISILTGVGGTPGAGGGSGGPSAPQNISPPFVTGGNRVGEGAIGNVGTWTENPVAYAVRWLIDGEEKAQGFTYTFQPDDEGKNYRISVVADNGLVSEPVESITYGPVLPSLVQPPVNTTAPTLSPSTQPRVGTEITATSGTWTNSPTGYAYQWLRDAAEISGATSNTYTPVVGDVGALLRVRVTASNSVGPGTPALSTQTAAVLPLAPVNTTAPSAPTGTTRIGETLTAQNGLWANNPTGYTYQWQRGTTNIAGATAGTYTLVSADVGNTIRVVVTATNAGGSNSANSAATATVLPLAPVNTAAPGAPTGTARVGQVLTAQNGVWSNSPTGYTYQWQRGTTDIAGATSNTYTLVEADAGSTIRVVVTATNAGGSASANSAATATVLPLAPTNTTAPGAPTGTAQEGQTLTAQNGVWANNPTGYTYQWQRGTTSIVGATAGTYTVQAVDVGSTLRVVVTATNAGGSNSANSANTAVVTAAGSTVQWDTGTTAALATATNKIEWCDEAIDLFNDAPSYLKITRDGTTVYNGMLSEPFSRSAGNLVFGGDITDQLTALQADLATGNCLWRIESGSRYATGTIGLTGSGKMWIVPASLPDPATELYSIHFAGCQINSPVGLPAAADVELYQVQMVNDTGSVQAANFTSPMFGAGFKQGDIPAGTYPYFRTASGGTVCPATLHSITSWPDGSMKFCGVLLNVPASVPATGSLAVSVRSGGNAPEAGTRTTANLTAADINVQMVGVDGLTGTWTASLNDGVTTATDVVQLANGPAGAIWKIGSEVRDSGNAAHGQLYCWHYVVALSNTDGSFRGLRYLGRVAQPWGDVTTPAARSRDATMSLRRGATVIRNMQGVLTTAGTVGSTVRVLHYGSVFTADTTGKYDYVQGGGSDAADCVVRVTVAPAYLKTAALVAPWDLTVSPGTSSAVNYYPGGKGACQDYDMRGTGERPEIGLLPRWSVQHMIQQDAGFERMNRVTSLCGGAWKYNVRQALTGSRQIVPVTDVQASYAGLGTIQTAWRFPGAVTGSINNPTPNDSPWVEDAGHQPAAHYWPYLFTGEPQFLDMQTELASSRVLRNHNGASMQFSLAEPVTTTSLLPGPLGRGVQINGGTVRKGASVFFVTSNGYREAAWGARDLVQGAALLPDTPPDGAAVRAYLRDVATSGVQAIVDYSNGSTAQRRNDGLFILSYSPTFAGNDTPWMLGFYTWAITHCADILPSSTASAARSFIANFWRALELQGRLKLAISYRMNAWDADTLAPSAAGVKWFRYTPDESSIVFSTSDSFGEFQISPFTTPAPNFSNVWAMTPQNGDIISFAHQETGEPYDTWNSASAYSLGDRRISAGVIYSNILAVSAAPAANPAPAADATHWQDIGAGGATTWNSRSGYAVDDTVVDAGRQYQCILTVTAKPLNPAPAADATHWQSLGSAYVNPYLGNAPDRKTLYLVNVSGRRFQCALTPGGAPLTVTNTLPVTGNFGSAGNLSRSAYVWDANGYGPLMQGAINYLAATGENMGTCEATMATTAGTINFAGNPKYKALGVR